MCSITVRLVVGASLALANLCSSALAGSLAPPDPPASTMKTLDQVEPRIPIGPLTTPGDATATFRITQPGSYYLTGNVTGVAGRNGIAITTSRVTLDLMGFELRGVTNSLTGVIATTSGTNITIVNGSVTNWGVSGVNLQIVSNCRIEGVLAGGNAQTGIGAGFNAVAIDCAADNNGGSGFVTPSNAILSNCAARLNIGSGFSIGAGSVVTACSSRSNSSNGFVISSGSRVVDSVAFVNNGHGFLLAVGVSIEGCAAQSNGGSGISASTDCLVLSNVCRDNDLTGVVATGTGNRIEGNVCVGNQWGFGALDANNIFVRNSARASAVANYDLVALNRHGAIVNISGAGPPAVSGSTAPNVLLSTDPWANFSY